MALTRITKGVIKPNENYDTHNINSTGIVTAIGLDVNGNGDISGNLNVGGVLTYEDVTSIDSVGVITARDGIHVGAGVSAVGVGTFSGLDISGDLDVDGHTNLDNVSVAGVTTFSDDVIFTGANHNIVFDKSDDRLEFADGAELSLGDSEDFKIHYEYLRTFIRQHGAGPIVIDLLNQYNSIIISKGNLTGNIAEFIPDGAVELYHNNTKRFETSSSGINVVGTTTSTQLAITGVSTFTGNIDANGDLDVDGHTELDNLRVSGIATVQDDLHLPDASKLLMGDNNEFRIYHNESNQLNYIVAHNNAPLLLRSNNADMIHCSPQGPVTLKYNGGTRAATSSSGFDVSGTLNVTGISTFEGNIDINADIDVDGHTELDNVSVAGISTFSGIIDAVNTPASIRVAQDIQHKGDADTKITFPANDTISFDTAGDERLRIKSDGAVNIGDVANNTWIDSTLKVRKDQNAVSKISVRNENQGSGASAAIVVNAYGNSWMFDCGSAAKNSNALTIRVDATANSNQGTEKLKIDTSGHITPGVAGAQNLGSASAEWGNLFIADSKKAYFGSDQDLEIYHSGTNSVIKDAGTGVLSLQSNGTGINMLRSNGDVIAQFFTGGSVEIYEDGTKRLETTTTGVTVTGEVAASQDYPNFRPTLDFNFAAEKKLDPRITYSRTGAASFVNEFGKVVIVGDNVPRFDHDPTTRESKGLLIEEERTNLFLYGTTPGDNWTGLKSGTFEENTTETTAPDGTFTATKWTFTSIDPYLYQTTNLSANTTYTMSMWVKAGTNMSGDVLQFRIGGAPFSTYDNSRLSEDGSWKRIIFTRTVGGSAESGVNVGFEPQTHPSGNPAVGDVIYIWGAQLEVGSFATSFIPTNGATASRGNEFVRMDGKEFSDLYNEIEGTFVSQHEILKDQSNMGIITFCKDFTNAERIELRATGANSSLGRFEVVTGNSSVVSLYSGLSHSGFGAGKNNKYAFAFKKDDYACTVNGVTPLTDTSGNMPTEINTMMIGDSTYGVKSNVYIKRIMYYPKRLPNSQLVTLTS